MRSSISAQSCESAPPSPAWTEHERVALVVLAGEEAAQLELGEAAVETGDGLGDLGLLALVLQLAGQLGQRLGVLELLRELGVAARGRTVTATARRSPCGRGRRRPTGRDGAASVSSCGRRCRQLVDAAGTARASSSRTRRRLQVVREVTHGSRP